MHVLIDRQNGNSVDHDQLASEKPADLGLHCFKKQGISGLSMVKLNNKP